MKDDLYEILEEHKQRIRRLESLLERRTSEFSPVYIPKIFDDDEDDEEDEDDDYEMDLDDYEDDDCESDFGDEEESFLDDDDMPPFCEVGLIGIIKWFNEWRRKMKLREGRYEL